MDVKLEKHLLIRIIIAVITFLSFIFCICATAGNYWGVYSDKNGNTLQHVGLWRECTRFLVALDFNCGTIALGDVNSIFQSDGTAKFNTTRAFILLSCITYGFVIAIFVLIFLKKLTLKPLCAVLFLLTLFQLIGMSVYADISTDSEVLKIVQFEHDYGWSYDLGWTSFVFNMLATILCVVGIYLQYVDNLKSGETELTAKQQFIQFLSEMKKAKEDKVLAITFAGIIVTIFAFTFCITATAGAYWAVYTDKTGNVRQHVGLWKECTNLLGTKFECGNVAIGDINAVFQTGGPEKFNTTRAFMILACIMYGVSFVLMALLLLKKLSLIPLCVIMFVTTFFELVAMSVYRNLDTIVTPLLVDIDHDYGWSYDLGWTSFVFSLIAACFFLAGILFEKRYTDETGTNDEKDKENKKEKAKDEKKENEKL